MEDQFWQRIGRAGRVLGKPKQDVPSFALGLLPDEALQALREKIGEQNSLSRVELKTLLHDAAEGRMQRASFAEYVQSYSLLEVTQPLSEMAKLLGTEHTQLIEDAFSLIKSVYAPASKKRFRSLKGEIFRLQNFQRLQKELRQEARKPDRALIEVLREYVQEKEGQTLSVEYVENLAQQILLSSKAKELLQSYIDREVMALQPVFSFRDSDIGIEIEADDPHGLVSPARETVQLTLFHLLRFYQWKLKEELHSEKSTLKVILQEIKEQPLQVSWTLRFTGSWEDFRKHCTKQPTALRELKLSLQQQGSIVPVPSRIAEAVFERYIPCLILDANDLKPWQWGSLIRDGIYYTDLAITCTESSSPPKKLRLLDGLDGYRVMGRYGWSLKRETGEWWIA